jgi:uncharacterized repeat protein (TIGR01451 family)
VLARQVFLVKGETMRHLVLLPALWLAALPVGAQSFDSATMSAPNFVRVGDPITYTIVVTTGATHSAPTASIRDHLPAPTPFVSGSLTCTGGTGTSCAYIPGTHVVEWTGALATSDTVTISFSVDTSAVAGGTYIPNEAFAEEPTFPSVGMSRVTCAIEPGNEPAVGAPFDLVAPDGSNKPTAPAPITWNSSGGLFLAALTTEPYFSGNSAVLARTIAPDGSLGAISQMNSTSHGVYTPSLSCSTAVDRCLVAYRRYVSASDEDIWARLTDGEGTPVGAEFPVYQDSGIQQNPSVVYNRNLDEFLVVWENRFADGRWDIQAQRIRASDGVFESWSVIATGAGEKRHSCGVDHNPDRDQYLFVYAFGEEGYQGRGKIGPGNLAGVSIDPEMTIWSTPDTGSDVSVVAGMDEFLVVWRMSSVSTGDSSIRGRRITGDGAVHGTDSGFFIGGFSPLGSLADPQAGYAGEHGYLVTWGHDDPDSPTTTDIHGRFVENGADWAAYSEFPVITSANWDITNRFGCAPTGECLLTDAYVNSVNTRFFIGWRIFTDGFESSELSQWSATVP